MASSPTANFIGELRQHGLLEPSQLDDVERKVRGKNLEPRALAQKLVEAGWLTGYQARLLLQGRTQELVVGPYIVLEQIGEGGMGQIVMAYDAGQAGNTSYIAMEFVEGTDLAKLVKQKGPVPIDKACAWIAQAAQ